MTPLGAALALALLHTAAAPGAAQQAPADSAAIPHGGAASARLPAGHWSVGALKRLHAAGLAPDLLPAHRGRTVAQARRAFADALALAGIRSPGMAPLAEGWRRELDAEFPAPAAHGVRGWGSVGAAAVRRERGGDVPGSRWIAAPSSGEDLVGRTQLGAELAGRVVARADVQAGGPEPRLAGGEIAAVAGGLRGSLAREPVGYGTGRGGGVTLSTPFAFDQIALETARPVALPGFLRHLGPVAFHTALARFPEAGDHAGRPWLWGAGAAVRPHPRLELALNRAALFGGDSASAQATPGRFLGVVVGRNEGTNFENQLLSVEARYRPPLGRSLPLLLYAEWGSEDAAGGFDEAPGVVAGVALAALPGAPAVELGVEYSYLGERRCCRTFVVNWYEHGALSFAGRGMPLAHPLAGNGTQWLAHARADLFAGRASVDARGFVRSRKAGNLVGEERLGRARGGELRADVRVAGGARVEAAAEREAGRGWSHSRLSVGGRWMF